MDDPPSDATLLTWTILARTSSLSKLKIQLSLTGSASLGVIVTPPVIRTIAPSFDGEAR